MSAGSILVIDDDVKLCELLHEYLARFDFKVDTANDPKAGLARIQKNQPDLVVLDVMLPQMDGFEVLKEIRKSHKLPVIMLTARGEVSDKVVGLELGADDYLAKPFEPRELVARMQTVLRRTRQKADKGMIRFGEMALDLDSHSVTVQGKELKLTTTEFEILSLFVASPGKVLTRDDLMEQVRGIDWDAFNRSIDVAVSRLRAKLGDDSKDPRYIKTIWRKGYMFVAKPG
ncbi:MAG: response regulator transcription factor [Arenicellales bacterium]|nr:response regulator transcription factor [Arenicellales bacterium]